MGIHGLSEYLISKYAGYEDFASDPPDTSFGQPINAIQTRILKDKIILIYDKITSGITALPMFQELNKELTGEFYWNVFQDLINNLAAKIEHMNLKAGFSFSIQLIEALNQLRNVLVKNKVEREKMLKMDSAIKSIQDHIWQESKRFLNLHNLKGTAIDTPELKGIVNTIVPTWDYGPGKNPAKGVLYKHPPKETPNKMMKRLLQEMKNEKKGK
jgi:hypothetical protein